MDTKKFKNLEIAGLFFTYLSGILLKFSCNIFDWEVWTIIFGAVNESTWEQIKVFTFPYLIWAAIEFCMVKIPIKPFFVSKTIGLYTIIMCFMTEFALYSLLTDDIPSVLRLLTSMLWCALGEFISYKVLTLNIDMHDVFILSIFMIILFISMYLSFTINPPHLNLFKDINLQIYGIPMCPVC